MLIEKLLKKLLAMLANNKAIEVKERVFVIAKKEDINKFLKARTVNLYIIAML
jgi:hypothetical protein